MDQKISKENLEKDKRVLGQKWLSTYGGWFSDEENIQMFIDAVKPHLLDHPLDILYVASASGLLGERLLTALGRGTLTIVDIAQEHLDANTNPRTTTIKADLLEMDLGKQFDLIIMRSALDYFPVRQMQIEVLRIIRRHLKSDGLFVNQPAYVTDPVERDILSAAYNATDKIGKRFFQSSDLDLIYQEAGLTTPEKVGEGKVMEISEQDHVERYDLSPVDIQTIQAVLKSATINAQVTEQGYIMKFEFPIFSARAR